MELKEKNHQKALELKIEGNKYFMKKEYEAALDLYLEALKHDQNSILFSNCAACLLSMSQYVDALDFANKSIEFENSNIKGHYRASLALIELNRYNEAIEILEKIKLQTEEIENLKEHIKKEKNNFDYCLSKFPSFPKFNQFFNWLSEGRVQFHKLKIQYYSDDHRGVVLKSDVKKDEIILKIPSNMLITVELAKESPLGKQIITKGLNLLSPKHSFLSCFILQEKEKIDSKWKHFISILPQSYSNFPIFFSEEEKQFLEGSPFLKIVNDKIRDINQDYRTLIESIEEFKRFSLKEFCEIRMAVSSRIFGITINGVATDCFAPLADMLNHKRPRQSLWYYSDELDSFVIQSMKDLSQGEEVFDSYGKKCNSRFLLNYGFIVENNDGNEFPFHIEINSNDPLFENKKKLLKPEYFRKTFLLQNNLSEQQVIDFFSFIRFKLYDEDDFNKLLNTDNYHEQKRSSTN